MCPGRGTGYMESQTVTPAAHEAFGKCEHVAWSPSPGASPPLSSDQRILLEADRRKEKSRMFSCVFLLSNGQDFDEPRI